MIRLDHALIGIDHGDVMLLSDCENNGAMWAGTGDRKRSMPIVFSAVYRTPPAVSVGFSLLDIDQGTNMRFDLKPENITTTGFDITLRTWQDTKIARARVAWQAIGELHHEDDWVLT